ncbi:lysophospholipid acyltransferase family protein [Sneathiella aquimaris]|uniref:lysophospholipid acyltransferase family protein n=1 Tax=Sneathiella aquimaris TaxID=2599305 RepID=UPI00146CB19C|nr:lysophospholipid acyltransferase family protein [Sneathiella aquimaris]
MFRRFLKSDAIKGLAGLLAALYIWLVYRTSRWTVMNAGQAHRYLANEDPFILAFWHGRLLMMPTVVLKKSKVHVLISHHADGEIISRAIGHWGQKSIRGSTSKGALPAIKDMLRVLKDREIAVITPDGPRGPRMRVQDGVIRMAAMSGVPVIPVSFSSTRGKCLSSWDRFFVAKPFGKGVVLWGDPIHVPRKNEDGAYDNAKKEIENQLTELTQQADTLCGQVPVEPDDCSPSQEFKNKVT